MEVGGTRSRPIPEQGASEAIGILIAAVVLLITFGSFVAAGLPLLTALMGIGIGVGLITAATGFVELSATTSILAVMIGLAVSIDYALFILSRFRSELADDADLDPLEAIGRAVGTAGSAVFFAGLTVVIALTGLAVVGIPILTEMGVAAAVTVAVAVLVADDAPAGPHRLRRPPGARAPHRASCQGQPRARAPDRVASLADLHLAPATARARERRGAPRASSPCPSSTFVSGLPDDSVAGPSTTQRKAYDLLAAGFGPGFNGPLTVVLDATGVADASDRGTGGGERHHGPR